MVLVPLIIKASAQGAGIFKSIGDQLRDIDKNVKSTNQSAKESSGYWRDVNGRLRDTQGRFVALRGESSGLASEIAQGVLQANLLTGAFGMAVNAIQRGISGIQGALTQGSQIQLQNIQAASTFASLTGQSYEQATAFVDKFNAAIAVSAAALPGETEQFAFLGRQITDSLIPAFTDASGVLDQSGLEENLMAITEAYGALSAAGNIDIGGTTMGISRALAGASFAELKELELFQNNSTLANALEKGLEEAGADTFEDLDLAQRIEIIRAAGESQITASFKEQAGRSVEGLMQSFQSSIFGPNGVFGVMRDLNLETEGVQSTFASYNESLILLIGENGILAQLGELFQEAGLTFDPMLTLKTGIDRFNSFLTNINDRLTNLNEALDEGGALTDMFSTYVKDAIADAKPFIKDLSGELFSKLGDLIPPVINFLSEVIIGAGKALYLVFENLDYGAALQGLGYALKGIDWGKLAIAVGVVLGGMVLGGLALGAVAMLGPIGLALAAGGLAIAGFLSTEFSSAGEFFAQMGRELGDTFSNLRVMFVAQWNNVQFAVINFLTEVRMAWTRIKQRFSSFVGGLLGDGENPSARSVGATAVVSAVNPGIGSLVGSGLRAIAGSRAGGQMPAGFASLLSAARTESRLAPAGASLVVANTSEAIIPRSAVQPLPATGGGGQRPINISIGNISSNATDPNAVADIVVRKIQALFEQEYNAQLT